MTMLVTSLRLTPEMLAGIKEAAHREALARKADVSWAELVREMIQRYLAQTNVATLNVSDRAA